MASRIGRFVFALILLLEFGFSPSMDAQQTKPPFTVADEIGLTLFDNPNGGPAEVVFSPNADYFLIKGYRGGLDINEVEDLLYVYRTQDVKAVLKHSGDGQPAPFWVITRGAKKEGAIGGYRWLADSSGLVLQEPTDDGNQRLMLADVGTKRVEPLTPVDQIVREFDVHDRLHYVYTVAEVAQHEQREKSEEGASSVVGTNRTLFELILPKDPVMALIAAPVISLWGVVDGKRFEIKRNGAPVTAFGSFSLSPDGKSIITTLPVTDVPLPWETLYPPPPYTISSNRIHAGHYDDKSSPVHEYVKIDLLTGSVEPLTGAPVADDSGWLAEGAPSWSEDGRQILLPNTFIKSKDGKPSRPCIVLVDIASNTSSCVETLKAYIDQDHVEDGYHFIEGARFVGDGRSEIQVSFTSHENQSSGTNEYQRVNGTWEVVRTLQGSLTSEQHGFEAKEKEGLNDPPILMAISQEVSKAILDPNPQLRGIEQGATVYSWKDKEGREWKGGLYKPASYESGKRYPLVIQTHGFTEAEFRPSGVFPTGMAARALAATGVIVLQTADGINGARCPDMTPEEGLCAAGIFESAVAQLTADGLVDPQRIGIVGFSRTCFGVMEMLTTSSLRLAAASVTDGVMFDLFQYTLVPERVSGEADRVIGASPFGGGLRIWQERSPGFNLYKSNTPLMVVGAGAAGLLAMWEPYAVLHYLHKPVDLIMLNTDEHVLTNPAVRYASQQGSVDWFRFWLQGFEDPDPSKQTQYVRWRGLKQIQDENDKKAAKN